jgi:hypothetical protein
MCTVGPGKAGNDNMVTRLRTQLRFVSNPKKTQRIFAVGYSPGKAGGGNISK